MEYLVVPEPGDEVGVAPLQLYKFKLDCRAALSSSVGVTAKDVSIELGRAKQLTYVKMLVLFSRL